MKRDPTLVNLVIKILGPRTGHLANIHCGRRVLTCIKGDFGAIFNTVNGLTQQRLVKEVHLLKSADDEQPLSVDDTVQIALLNNRGLQPIYAGIEMAEANLVRAGRLQNPPFSFKHTFTSVY